MSEKGKAILAYIFSCVGGAIVLYGMTDNTRNTKIHAAQAIVIGIGYLIIYAVYSFLPIYIPMLTTLIYGLYVVLVVIGIIKANNEENPEIPIVGEIAMSMFGKKIDE